MPNIWLAAVRIFLSSMVSPNLWGRYCGELAPCALWVEAEPACSEPSVGVDLRIILRRFQGTIQAFSEPGQKKQSIERDSEHNKVSLKATLAIRY